MKRLSDTVSTGRCGMFKGQPSLSITTDRGTNENTNGLLRECFPKGEDITDVGDEEIFFIADQLNRRRKCLGFRTPYEVYYSKTLHLI